MSESVSVAYHIHDEVVYDRLMPHQKKFYDTVKAILEMGITPTPKVVNQALGKPVRTSWNGPLCKIRSELLVQYGYERVEVTRGLRGRVYRWKKKSDA